MAAGSSPETPPPAETPSPEGRPHSARQALALLCGSLVAFLLVLTLLRIPGELVRTVVPALAALCWILPAYELARRAGHDPFRVHGVSPKPRGLLEASVVSLVILGAYVAGLWAWKGAPTAAVPWGQAAILFGNHLLLVALPEEYFFRGVLQPALDREGGPARTLLGAPFGRGALLSAALFALCHFVRAPSVQFVAPSVYTLLIVFPGLWFAWLRARTGSILPGVAAHALANAFELACLSAWGLR